MRRRLCNHVLPFARNLYPILRLRPQQPRRHFRHLHLFQRRRTLNLRHLTNRLGPQHPR